MQRHLVHPQCGANATSGQFQSISIQNKTPYPLSGFSPVLALPSTLATTNLLLSLWMSLFWIFHINGIEEFVYFL